MLAADPPDQITYPLLLVSACQGIYLMTPAEDAWKRLEDTRIWVLAATVGLPIVLALVQRMREKRKTAA